MNLIEITLSGAGLSALPTGALWWKDEGLLCVSDLHLGKSDRIARRGGGLLPPYEVQDTLARLEASVAATGAQVVVCLGDSFDDLAAAEALSDTARIWLTRLQAGRRWIWIEGNHDPGPIDLGGTHLLEMKLGPLTFRHISEPGSEGEISGHFHPKAQLTAQGRRISRPCFLVNSKRLIMPAFGTYTGGLGWTAPQLQHLMAPKAQAILLGNVLHSLPMPFD